MNTQVSKNTTLFLNYPKMLQVWNATEFVFLSDKCVGFKVSTPTYKGTVIITWQDNAFYSVCFREIWNSRFWESPMQRRFWMR